MLVKHQKPFTRLFPNKVAIHMPQDENLLTSWKQQLDRDAETLKMKGNLNNLRNLLTNEGAEKVVRWALSHHLMQACSMLKLIQMQDLLFQMRAYNTVLKFSKQFRMNPRA